jgi:hypothetical protein
MAMSRARWVGQLVSEQTWAQRENKLRVAVFAETGD